jgi:RNA polymerase sigma-70 factor (ECF subfamily)
MYPRRPIPGSGHSSISGELSDLRRITDEELARELSHGCDDALGILYERFAANVLGIARRVIGEHSEAEDTVQQVFIELHRAAGRLSEEKGSVRSWLHARAFQRALNKREHLESIGFYTSKDIDHVSAELERGAAARFQLFPPELSRLVDELLNCVSSRQRVVIKLYLYEGLTMEQIAARIGQTVAVVRHNFYNGLRKMRAVLDGHERIGKITGVDSEQ